MYQEDYDDYTESGDPEKEAYSDDVKSRRAKWAPKILSFFEKNPGWYSLPELSEALSEQDPKTKLRTKPLHTSISSTLRGLRRPPLGYDVRKERIAVGLSKYSVDAKSFGSYASYDPEENVRRKRAELRSAEESLERWLQEKRKT